MLLFFEMFFSYEMPAAGKKEVCAVLCKETETPK